MVRAGLLLSASLATLFAPRTSASTACESCLTGSGTFCSYQTSAATPEAGYGICYTAALSESEACPATYGALKDTYGDVTLERTTFDDGTACTSPAKSLATENTVTFDTFANGGQVTGIDTCTACVDGTNTWCQPKSSSANLAGGYCAKGQTDVTCMTLLLVTDFESMKKIDKASDCTTTTSTAATLGPCTTCLDDSSKQFCAYSTTGTDDAKTYLYHACIDGTVTDCPTMTGIDDIYSGLKAETKVSAEKVNTRGDCAALTLPQDANLDLNADLDMTKNTTCSDCISSQGKWCNYDADTVKGGYCGVDKKCAKLEKFDSKTINNVPVNRNPSTECDNPSAGFALSSSCIALAAGVAALVVSA